MNDCPSENRLVAFVEQRLPAGDVAAMHRHLDGCSACRSLVADLAQAGLGDDPQGTSPVPTGNAPPDLDEYRLERPLGRGAMGLVYLAHDTVLDRPVAIKWLMAVEPDASARARFLVEARAIARLQHPNVVGIYRVGQVDGRQYLVSEYVAGKSLDRLEKPLAWERVLPIAVGLARGLAAAHRRGVVHRDIKPANVILADGGDVKLLDFGLAKLVESRPSAPPTDDPRSDEETNARLATSMARATQALRAGNAAVTGSPTETLAGSAIGTPLYMAPEVWRGEAATPRSDVYSLGALLYEIASGRPPHRGSSQDELRRSAIEGDATPLAEVLPQVEPRFAAIVDRCVRRGPEERFASGEELEVALEPLLLTDPATLPGGSPYRGLYAFEAEHRSLFFGRSQEIRAVLERLLAQPLVLVAGDSGVGKSSLCRAGVLPLCGEGVLAGGRLWSVAAMVPGRRPLAALADALGPLLGEPPATLAERLRARPDVIDALLQDRLAARAGVLLFVDQLEELLTQSEPDEAAAMGEILGRLATLRPSVRVLATVRGDFLTRLAALPGLGTRYAEGLYILAPLSGEGLREIIGGPARRLGVAFESEAMVEELALATLHAEGGLPLLEFALAELWERRDRERGVIPREALGVIGGVGGALARHADGVLARMSPTERRMARRILCKLVTAEGMGARRSEAELTGDAELPLRSALEALVRGRLVVAKESGESTYEIAHEALVTSWQTLREWLAGDGERRVLRQRVERAAVEWDRLGRAREALWSARQLEELGAQELDLTLGEREFLAASKRAARRRRLITRALIVGIPLVVALVYGGVSFKARRDLDRNVDTRLGEARAAVAEARGRAVDETEARQRAFAAFDRRERDLGETTWTRARALATTIDAAWSRAGQALETALLLDPHRRDVHDLLGEVLYQRALLAERDARTATEHELLARLALYDESGALRRRWDAPATLRIDSDPPGAAVTIARYLDDERGKRTLGRTTLVGTTRIVEHQLSPGSYLLELSAPGRATVRYPLLVARGEKLPLSIALPPASAIPPDFVFIPAGRFLFGAADEHSRSFFGTYPLHEVQTGTFLIALHETTFAEWITYLRMLPPDERRRRLPHTGSLGFHGTMELRERLNGSFELLWEVTQARYRAAVGERFRYLGRDRRVEQDWLRFPVSGISCDDAEAYAAWLDASGRVSGARLCTEYEWERAARGADDREFPHGNSIGPDDANYDDTYGKAPSAFGPDEVGSHPVSQSPFGLDDTTGNVLEWTRSSLSATRCVSRSGGFYFDAELTGRLNNRTEPDPTGHDPTQGARICATYPAPVRPEIAKPQAR